jgi:hypothetical protein
MIGDVSMQSLTLHARVGKDGILKIETPIGITDTELDVILVISPTTKKPDDQDTQAKGWPPGFFTEVIGGWQGEPQGKYETRDELK